MHRLLKKWAVFFMINLNGTLLDTPKATVAIDNRGLNYGDALFETLRYSEGRLFFWEDHYFRLMASMRLLRMEIPMDFTMEFLSAEILRTIHASGKTDAPYRVKLLVWRKAGGKYTPKVRDVAFAVTLEKLDAHWYALSEADCEIELFKDHYVSAGLLATLKTTNRLINILGSIYAKENFYDNCLLLNTEKQVVEALNGNIFLVSGQSVKTPPLVDGCLNGIMRKQLISIIKRLPGFVFEEKSISPFELQKADEIFITNTIKGILSVTKYRKKTFGNEMAKLLLPKLNELAKNA